MNKTKLLALGLGLAVIAIFTSPASAQDGPSITVEPTTVDAAGEQEFTVTGAGWTAAPPIFVLPCAAPESGDAADVDADTCDTTNLTPATPEDGAFEVTVTFDVPAEGIAIAAANAGQTEAAAAIITVGDSSGGGTEGGETEGGETEGSETEESEELANTGVESGLIAVIAVAVLAAGALVVGYTRRFA